MKKFKFRLQVVLEMREHELEQRQMEMAKILSVLRQQEAKLGEIIYAEQRNMQEMEALYEDSSLDIQQLESHRTYGIKLSVDEKNQRSVIANTQIILERKQTEVREAHKKVEVLKKLKEKQEQKYYKDFLDAEVKEIDDMTTSRFKSE